MKYLILNEKNSAMRNFSAALGGPKGHFDNFDYELVAARGHLMKLSDPQDQVSDVNFQDKVKQWSNTDTIPWHLDRFKWNKTYIVGRNYRTGRKESTKSIVDNIKAKSRGVDAIVIATDNDPSGEGDVLGQEIINKIGWKGQVLRCRFKDESKPAITSALQQLDDVTDLNKNQNYNKGLARERFDYATMQLSRVATRIAREQNYDVLIRPGRLKSVIVETLYKQIHDRDTFVQKDQYQAIFQDELGTKFINNDLPKYDTETLAGNDITKLHESTITVDQAKRKSGKAPKLMNFAQVDIAVSKTGVPSKTMIATYQKMYQDGYVSYPRTEDNAMTTEQWNQLSGLADTIAQVVGVDPSLLTQRKPRSPYVSTKDLSHGSNRPGLTVPNSLQEIEGKYGNVGVTIYTTLAKSYLAALAGDYQYDMTKAFVTDFPKFTATKNVPVDPGYKAILGNLEDTSDKDEDKSAIRFGKQATPVINASKTTPPQKPTKKFILNYLIKHEVGTGATQSQTLSSLSEGKNAIIKETRSELKLTPEGMVAGALMSGTMLASPKITKQLSEMTKQVGANQIPMDNIYRAVTVIIQKDEKKMEANAQMLDQDSYLDGKLPPKSANQQAKFHGTFKDGTEVSFKKNFMTHHFSEQEAQSLLKGNTIKIEVKTKKGLKRNVSGNLEQQSFKDKKGKSVTFWGFKAQKWG